MVAGDLTLSLALHVTAGDCKPVTEAYATSSGIAAEPAYQTIAKKRSQKLENPANATTTVSMDDRNKILVLIVDYNAVNLKIATLMTEKLGLQVIAASNGKEALDILETRAESGEPSPDIILMDCMMPIMDGYDATRKLRQDTSRFSARSRSTPIIALTASAHKGDMERCLEAGMDDYMTRRVLGSPRLLVSSQRPHIHLLRLHAQVILLIPSSARKRRNFSGTNHRRRKRAVDNPLSPSLDAYLEVKLWGRSRRHLSPYLYLKF